MGFQKGVKQTTHFLWDLGGSGNSAVATGTIPIFSAPENCLIHGVRAHVLTLVAGSSAEELGDGNDPDGFLVDGFAAGTGIYPTGAEDANCGAYQKTSTAGGTDAADVSRSEAKKLYSSADTIDFKITGTATAGKIRFYIDYEVLY
jgi:hypothetical protein